MAFDFLDTILEKADTVVNKSADIFDNVVQMKRTAEGSTSERDITTVPEKQTQPNASPIDVTSWLTGKVAAANQTAQPGNDPINWMKPVAIMAGVMFVGLIIYKVVK